MRAAIDLSADLIGVVASAAGRAEDADDAPLTGGFGAKQLAPNMGTRARFLHTPTIGGRVFDGGTDRFVGVSILRHRQSSIALKK